MTREADMITLTGQDIDKALGRIADGLCQYIWIQSRFQHCDVSTDLVFQTAFNGFYRVRRNADWRERFYTLFETARASGITFDQAFRELLQRTERYEASFASKLVATLDPTKPVVDKFVLGNFDLRLPYYSASEREVKTIGVYNELCGRYETFMRSPLGRTICARFTLRYPQADITDLKKIDLVLWQTRG